MPSCQHALSKSGPQYHANIFKMKTLASTKDKYGPSKGSEKAYGLCRAQMAKSSTGKVCVVVQTIKIALILTIEIYKHP